MIARKASESTVTAPASSDVDGAVGMERSHWYVAIVNHNSEIKSARRLADEGYDCFAATQKELRVWRNGKRHMIDRVVIGSAIFIHCTERQRRAIVTLPFVNRFLTNKAGAPNEFGRPVATIPPAQIQTLLFMLGQTDTPVEFVSRPLELGTRVRVIRGNLRGLEGHVIATGRGRGDLIVSIDILGCAKLTIPLPDVEPIDSRLTPG